MLSQHEIVRLALNEGDEVNIEAGTVWLTFEANDFIVQRGESFRATARGEVMMQGLGEDQWHFRVRKNLTAQTSPSALQMLRSKANEWARSHHIGGGTHSRVA